jgi:hypothetical protein
LPWEGVSFLGVRGVSDGGNVEWVRNLRARLAADIQTLRARAREGAARPEELGLLPDSDRLADLRRRLAQVDRLIEAIEDADQAAGAGWPGDLGDPAASPQTVFVPGEAEPLQNDQPVRS